ncbi:MAG: hypothetical protein RMK30_07385 [Anaerolineae bacterium]|nr:DUF1232 domain-containing protein [Anaerolineae bacterium]MDW8102680.1 hypothetical protein [Anaerolineae bacterium]
MRFKQIRLLWNLFWDPRVPLWFKVLVVLIPLVYILLPTDLFLDTAPILGPLDDIILVLLVLKAFLELTPRRVREEQERRMESISAPYRVLDKKEGKN